MVHDRIHAREPTHHRDRWTEGTLLEVTERDGHAVLTVEAPDGEAVELVTTHAVRDLFLSRLDVDVAAGESPAGEKVWYRKKGG